MSQDGEACYRQGTAMLESERFSEAIRELNQAVMLLPGGSELSIASHLNLAKALLDWPGGDRPSNWEKAIRCLKDLLRVCSKTGDPETYAEAQNLLGCAYRALFEANDDADYLRWAIEHFKEAFGVTSAETNPEAFCSYGYNAAALYGYAEMQHIDVGSVAVFEARHLLERILPVAKRAHHPKLALYRKLYEDIMRLF